MSTIQDTQPGGLREQLLADIENTQQEIETFNSHILNHKHFFSAVGAGILILLYLGMVEPRITMYVWGFIGTIFVILAGVTYWKKNQAERLNAQLDSAQKAFKEYEKGRRKKRKK